MFDKNLKVLVVDDMSTMRKIVSKNLTNLGFQNIVEAADGVQAWELISSANSGIGLVVSDWNMPNCSGLDLLKRVRADSRFKTIPFVLVTAENEQAQVVEALKAGVNNYLVKPFTPDSFRANLEATFTKISKAG